MVVGLSKVRRSIARSYFDCGPASATKGVAVAAENPRAHLGNHREGVPRPILRNDTWKLATSTLFIWYRLFICRHLILVSYYFRLAAKIEQRSAVWFLKLSGCFLVVSLLIDAVKQHFSNDRVGSLCSSFYFFSKRRARLPAWRSLQKFRHAVRAKMTSCRLVVVFSSFSRWIT